MRTSAAVVWNVALSGRWRSAFDYLQIVVAAHEVGRLKLRVAEANPDAFVAISSAQEVLGEGFAPQGAE